MFDCSTPPDSQGSATQTGTATFTGAICFASDDADAFCVVSFEFDAFCDCETSPPVASPLVASPEPPPVVASPVVASPPTPFCDCSFDWPVWFLFPAQASPERLVFDCSTPPDLQWSATQTGTATFTGAICSAFDSAEAFCVVSFEFDAFCDCETSPPVASPLVASPDEPQQPLPPVVASPVVASPP